MIEMMIGSAEPEDYGEIERLIGRAFKNSSLERTMVEVATREDQNFRPGDLRVVKIGQKIVSMMLIMRRQLRIGSAVVEGALVGPVATLPEFERQGYCSAVMRDGVRHMREQGLDLTILWGHPWLYPRYRYSAAMMSTELVLRPPRREGVFAGEKCEFRPFREEDLTQVTGIYHENTGGVTCAEIRSPSLWEWRSHGSAKLEVLEDSSGVVVGYLALGTDWGHPAALEIGALNNVACEAIYGRLMEMGWKEVPCLVHPRHPFARFAFWQGGEVRIRSGGGAGMARVLNISSLLSKLVGVLGSRLAHSELYGDSFRLRVSCEEGTAVIRAKHGEVAVDTDDAECELGLDLPVACLNPLVTGYNGIDELATDPQARFEGGERTLRLAEILFPEGFPRGGHMPLVWE